MLKLLQPTRSSTPLRLPDVPFRQFVLGSLGLSLLFLLSASELRAQSELSAPPVPTLGAEEQASDASAATGEVAAPPPAAARTADPSSRALRLSFATGAVSSEPPGVNTFSVAELNQVLTTGDRLYTDPEATAEVETGQVAVRLGGGTDLTVTALTDALAQFGVASGSAHLRSVAIDPGMVLELDSPEAAVTVLQPGDVRVDVDPASHTTDVSVLSGQVQVDAPGASQVLNAGQRVKVHGANPDAGQQAYAEPLSPADPDSFDTFSSTRDNTEASGADAASAYVNPDTTGSADLASYGAWGTSDFGPVWYPVVATDWRPYAVGRWRYVSPWGWTWVGAEPWAFAPFHYGRWAEIGGRWGWIPGPRVVRPVYAPALVVFAGGAQFAESLGYAAGFGITAWFPLGPHEPYAPPYRTSTLYRNRVNVSNLYNGNAAEVQGLYHQRAVSVYPDADPSHGVYSNRLSATTVVPQSVFAAGRSVQRAGLRIPADALASAPLLGRAQPRSEQGAVQARTAATPPAITRRPGIAAGVAVASPGVERAEQVAAPGNPAFYQHARPPSITPGSSPLRNGLPSLHQGPAGSPPPVNNLRLGRPEGLPAARTESARPTVSRPGPAPAPASSTAPPGRPR